MYDRPAAQSFGWNLGILSGVFAALQVLISASTARANISSIESMRWALARLTTGGGNPVPLLGSLAPVVLVTYASMLVTGAVSLGLCWYAGRLTAFVRGRRTGGAGAGFRVALLSGIVWIVFSVIISLLLHGDGTITGILSSTQDGSSLLPQLSGLLIQEFVLAAIGLGLGAWAGYLGAGSAPLPEVAPVVYPAVSAYGGYGGYGGYGMYPAYPAYPPNLPYPTSASYPGYSGYPGYPGYGGYPIASPAAPGAYPPSSMPPQPPQPPRPPQPAGAVPPTYPPPPNYYRGADTTSPVNPGQQPPQVEQPSSAPDADIQPPAE